jgi:hypothetical protein
MRETQWSGQSPRPDKFHVESAIFYHRPAYSLKQSQICAFEKMLSLRLLLLQLLQCTLRVSATSPLEEQSPDRIFLPGQDWSVNRADLEHLVPSYSSRLMFLEEPQSSLAMSTTMTMMFPTIILENSAFVRSVRCSSNVSMAIQISNAEAFEKIRQWPGNDLVLVTNRLSCNPANERGIFLTHETNFDLDTLVVEIETRRVSWKEVAKTMQIDYLEIEGREDAGAGQTVLHNEL